MTTIIDAVFTVFLSLSETEEVMFHGSPTDKAARKSFAIYSLNHHGNDKVVLLVNLSNESRQTLVSPAPKIFFVPPDVGPKG